jgi:osmotically-inducible protein OsmY
MKYELPTFFDEHTEGAEIRAVKDKLTETRVAGVLATTEGVHAQALEVEVHDHTARVSGTVPQEREIEIATKAAGSVEGVERVDTRITVAKGETL